MVEEKNTEMEQKKAMMQQEIEISKSLGKIKHKVAVMSGKGGVGKSMVTVNLAAAFAKNGLKTGILDADLHGPNIPNMFGINDAKLLISENNKLLPAEAENGIKLISADLLLPTNDTPIIWRGPKKAGAIRQFISDAEWGNLDVLLIDNPPGTGDEPLTVLQTIPDIDGVVIVTTPQSVSLEDVEKCISMANLLKIKIFGIVENMSGFICPECETETDIFGKGGGEKIAKKFDIPFLGSIPLDVETYQSSEEGKSIIQKNPDSKVSQKLIAIAEKVENEFK